MTAAREPDPAGGVRARASGLLPAALVAVLLAAVSLPCLLEQARDVDVLLYSAAAVRANAHHALPYEAAWIEKGPLAMGLYQTLFLVFGPGNIASVTLAWLAFALLGAALSWRLASVCEPGSVRGTGARPSAATARALFANPGPWAAVLFAVSVGTVGGTLNTELPASIASAAAFLAWTRGARAGALDGLGRGGEARRSSSYLGSRVFAWSLLAGALAGAAFLGRQNAGALWPLLIAGEVWLVWRGRRAFRAAAVSAAAVSLAFLAMAGAVAALYALRGTLPEMLFCVYGYNRDIYIAATKVDAARLTLAPLTAAKNFLLPVWTTSALGLAGIAIAATYIARARRAPRAPVPHAAALESPQWQPGGEERDGDVLLPVLALTAIGLTLSLFPGLRFFSHYFALPLPFWAALGGVAAARAMSAQGRRVGAVAAAIVLVSLGAELARRPWVRAAREVKEWVAEGGLSHPGDASLWPGHDPLAGKSARWLREHAAPGDTVFVWGMRPHVPLYAGLVPATRFVTCTFLTGLVPWERVGSEEDTSRWIVPGAWDLLARDLDAERPAFIVDASRDHLFGMGAYPPSKFPELQARLDAGYEPAFDTGGDERLVVWRRKGPQRSPGRE